MSCDCTNRNANRGDFVVTFTRLCYDTLAGVTFSRVWEDQYSMVPFSASDGYFLTSEGYVILVKRR